MTEASRFLNRLWAITAYFNPAAYRRKAANYRAFRQRLAVPLVTVELCHDGPFELRTGDADILIQLRGGDVMWQKERLLNVALSKLPPECDYAAWLDCDIVFDRQDWPASAIQELDRTSVCQLYRTVHHLLRDVSLERMGPEVSFARHDSMGYACSQGLVTSPASTNDGIPGAFKRGHAWCARREVLAEHGFYDRSILGSGDRMLAFAATNQIEEMICQVQATPGHAEDYRRWATGFRRDVDRIGYIEGNIFHLWHGDFTQRQYTGRQDILRRFDYDPAADIALDPVGCWRWNSSKPDMHRRIREYFAQRFEDGEPAAAAG